MDQIDREWWMRAGDQVMAAVPSNDLMTIVTGNLAKAMASNTSIQTELRKYDDRSAVHPHIYIRQLTIGPDHNDLTIRQAKSLAHAVERYTQRSSDTNNEAYYIDKSLCSTEWLREWSEKGLRASFMNDHGVNDPAIENIFKTFSNMVTQLVKDTYKNKKKHIVPMYCIGYADNVADREARIKDVRNIHNALIDFASHFLTLGGADVKIHTIPICLLARQEIAPVAEKVLGRVTRTRFDVAGFTIPRIYNDMKPAGSLSEAAWEANSRWLVRETPYVANLEREVKYRIKVKIRENTPGTNMESLTDALREARALME